MLLSMMINNLSGSLMLLLHNSLLYGCWWDSYPPDVEMAHSGMIMPKYTSCNYRVNSVKLLAYQLFWFFVCRCCSSHILIWWSPQILCWNKVISLLNKIIITLKGKWISSFLRRVGAQAPAVMTSCFALNIALLVTTVTTGPGVISVTMWLSSSTPPFFLYRCYTVWGNQEMTKNKKCKKIYKWHAKKYANKAGMVI